MSIYKKGDRFGNAEIIGVGQKAYNLLCGCGDTFSRSIVQVNRGSTRPIQCSTCAKPEQSHNLEVRDYTEEESKMIQDFQDKI